MRAAQRRATPTQRTAISTKRPSMPAERTDSIQTFSSPFFISFFFRQISGSDHDRERKAIYQEVLIEAHSIAGANVLSCRLSLRGSPPPSSTPSTGFVRQAAMVLKAPGSAAPCGWVIAPLWRPRLNHNHHNKNRDEGMPGLKDTSPPISGWRRH